MDPSPVFASYWRFAAERQAMYFRRLKGERGPWTKDPILSNYRFTNVFRASDRVSQYLIREVQYHPDRSTSPAEVFFRTILFKFFNRIETWEALESRLGRLTWQHVDIDAINKILDELMARGVRLYSAAYIMASPSLGYLRKHANHLALLSLMMGEDLPRRVLKARSLRAVYDMLIQYPGLGPFLAYQYSIDLNYSELMSHSENDFVVAGPGALDGISKCFENTGKRSPEAIIEWVCDRQDRAFADAGLDFQLLFGRRLHLIDCQNLFCEISKYARVAHPDVSGISGRTRIKQVYRPHSEPLMVPVFPTRWGLDVSSVNHGKHSKHIGKQVELLA